MARFDKVKLNPNILSRSTVIAGLLRGEMADRAGLSRATIAEAFSGRPVGVRAARAIAKALGVTIADLAADELKTEAAPCAA